MGMTITEKICARAAAKDRVAPGDMIDAEIDRLYIKDLRFSKAEDPQGLYGVFKEILKGMGITKAWDPDRVIINFDESRRGARDGRKARLAPAIFPRSTERRYIRVTTAASATTSWWKRDM